MLSRQNSSAEPSSSTTASSNTSISVALDQIKDKLVEAQKALEKIDEVQQKSKSLQSLKPAPLDVEDLVALDRAHQHLLWLDVISKVLEKSKGAKKDHDVLVSCHNILSKLVEALIDSSCLNLRNYALKSLIYLRSSYLPALEVELEADLEALNYPRCVLVRLILISLIKSPFFMMISISGFGRWRVWNKERCGFDQEISKSLRSSGRTSTL